MTNYVLAQETKIYISKNEVASAKQTVSAADLVQLNNTVKSVQMQGGGADEIEVTVLGSKAKEFALGLSDAGTMTIDGHWAQTDEGQIVLKNAAKDNKARLIKLVFNDGTEFSSLAFVKQRSFTSQVSGVITASFSLRLTGETVETDVLSA